MFARRDVLNHTDEIVDRPVALAHAADRQPGPDDRSILARVALVQAIAVDRPVEHALDLGKIGRKIVRVGDVLQRPGDEFIEWVAENAAQRLIGPEPPEVRAKVCDTNRRILERGTEPRLAVGESAPSLDLLVNHLIEKHRATNPAVGGAPRLHRPPHPIDAAVLARKKVLLVSQLLARQHTHMILPPARRQVWKYLVSRTANDLGGVRQ